MNSGLFVILIIGFLGFGLSFFLHSQKKKTGPIICPLGGKCDEVVRSKYGTFLGFSNTVWGMIVYLIIFFVSLLAFLGKGNSVNYVWLFLITIISFSFLFSLYLLAVQSFVLKKFCTWCILSAIFVTVIFILVLLNIPDSSILVLSKIKPIILFIHALSAGVGVGVTTVTDIMFFRFLKDFKVSHFENENLKILSEVLWMALGVLILTGIALYLPSTGRLNESSKFLLKVCVVGIIFLNGLVLNFIVTPLLPKMRFDGKHDVDKKRRMLVRKLAFFCGGVSIFSWYLVFLLGSVRSIPLSFQKGIILYFVFLVLILFGSQFFEKILRLKALKDK